MIEGKGVARHPAVVERDFDNVFQAFEITADGRRLEPQIGFKVDVVLLDERLLQFGQGHIAHVILLTHESPQMVDGFIVAVPCTVAAVDADTFLEVAGEFLERFEKQPVFLSEAEIGILDLSAVTYDSRSQIS